MDIELNAVCLDNAPFICSIMNEQSVLDMLNEVPTQLNDWKNAIV